MDSRKKYEKNADYYFKRTFAFIIAPIYLCLIVFAVIKAVSIPFALSDFLVSLKNYVDFNVHPTLGMYLVVFSLIGFVGLIFPIAAMLNREEKVPFPGFNWVRNKLYSETFLELSPTGNQKVTIAELREARQTNLELQETNQKLDALNLKTASTLNSINKLHQSLYNIIITDGYIADQSFESLLGEVANEVCISVLDRDSDKSCSIMFIDEDQKLRIYGHSRINSEVRLTLEFPIGYGFAGSVWNNTRAEICNDVDTDPRYIKNKDQNFGSMIGVPIFFKSSVIGVICVQDAKKHAFCDEDITLVTSYVEFINLVIILKEKFVFYRHEVDVIKQQFEETVKATLRQTASAESSDGREQL